MDFQSVFTNCKKRLVFRWGDFSQGKNLVFDIENLVLLSLRPYKFDKQELLSQLGNLNWQILSFSPINYAWEDAGYIPPGFGDGLGSLGWGCAFHRESHQRIVSRRWLDYGPFLVTRDEASDISLVQFHDFEADAMTALEQAKPGHEWIRGREGVGGFIQRDYNILSDNFAPLYEADTQTIKIVVYGRTVTKAEMLDACATRYWQLLGADKPVERAAFVFIDEKEARANLFELWLRELECWAVIKGVETRLDSDYVAPAPVKPDWVNRIKGSSSLQEIL
jgi:hypothetical protein